MKKTLLILIALLLLSLAGCGGREEEAPEEAWYDAIPWGETWTCLLMGHPNPDYELEPEAGKESLHTLLSACRWTAGEPREADIRTRRATVWCGEGEPFLLELLPDGTVTWNGGGWRPLGEGAAEKLLADFDALAVSGVSMHSPPALTISSGGETMQAYLDGTYSWLYFARSGYGTGGMGDSFRDVTRYDWLSSGIELLHAEGKVSLSFASGPPDSLSLSAVSPWGMIPAVLEDMAFIPYAGVNAYLLSADWDNRGAGGRGDACYVLLVEGDGVGAKLRDTRPDLRAALLGADASGCELVLEPGGMHAFDLGGPKGARVSPYALFRRTEAGGWEWLKPIREPEPGRISCAPGEETAFGLDWTWSNGFLEPGKDYALMLYGAFRGETAGIPQFTVLTFTAVPAAPPGPSAPVEAPEGVETRLQRRTPRRGRRFTQYLTLTGEGKYAVDRGFSLFRLEEDGTLSHISPVYRLPAARNGSAILTEGQGLELDIELAACYGELEPGTYVLRRRLLRLEGEVKSADPAWRYLPLPGCGSFLYLDVLLELLEGAAPAACSVDPCPPEPVYYGEDPDLPVLFSGGFWSSRQCAVTLTNRGEEELEYDPAKYSLYFLDGSEWLPLERRSLLTPRASLQVLSSGDSRELEVSFGTQYGTLPAGTYRLVIPARAAGDGGQHRLIGQFRVLQDGSGEYTGQTAELEALFWDLSRSLGAACVRPEGQEQGAALRAGDYDPYVLFWRVRQERDRLVVTVHRDGDADRVRALLPDYPGLEVVRGEDPPAAASPVREDRLGTRGELRAECPEQTDPRLHREGFWVLTFRWDGEETLHNVPFRLYPERKDGDAWRSLPQRNGAFTGEWSGQEEAVYPDLEPGENVLELNLGNWYAEFTPGREYRFALAILGPGGWEYYVCPFAVTMEGEA
jgi:hypothetical protein